MKFLLSAILAVTLPTLAAAQEFRLGDLEIVHPVIFETARTARAGAGYVTIINTGTENDALIGARADVAKAQIHQSYEENGMHRMRPAGRLAIPAGETLRLAPGGYHIMFMGLSTPFVAGEKIPVTLIFEHAGEIEVSFAVERRGEAMDHGQIDHGDMNMKPANSD